MDPLEEWFQILTRNKWTVFSSCIRGAWKPWDKFKALVVMIYTLVEALRYLLVFLVTDMDTALIFGGIYYPLGMIGRSFTLTLSFTLFGIFFGQIIVWFRPCSLLQIKLSPNSRVSKVIKHSHQELTAEQEIIFHQEARIILKMFKCNAIILEICFNSFIILCGLRYMYMTWSGWFSIQVLLSLLWIFIHLLTHEVVLYTPYAAAWFMSVGIKRISLLIDQSFHSVNQDVNGQCNYFIGLMKDVFAFNLYSKMFISISYITISLVNGAAAFTVVLLHQETTVAIKILQVILLVIIAIHTYLFSVATVPTNKARKMKGRVYKIIFHKNGLTATEKRNLLNIIKSQACQSQYSKLGLKTWEGTMFGMNIFFRQLFTSFRVLILLFKIIQPSCTYCN